GWKPARKNKPGCAILRWRTLAFPTPSDCRTAARRRRDPPGAGSSPPPGHKNSAAKRPLEWPSQCTTWSSESTCLYPGGWIVLASRKSQHATELGEPLVYCPRAGRLGPRPAREACNETGFPCQAGSAAFVGVKTRGL